MVRVTVRVATCDGAVAKGYSASPVLGHPDRKSCSAASSCCSRRRLRSRSSLR